MHLDFEGKVVLVTGGTKGIGRAIVSSFLAEGATVHFCSRTAAAPDPSHPSDRAISATVDVSQPAQVASWVTSCASQSGRIDAVVANVSALAISNDDGAWQGAFATDLMGTRALVDAAMPYLEVSKGSIVTIASVSGRVLDFTALPSPYGPMKAALVHYTSQLARTGAPKGIRANTVSPGNIYIEDGVWGNVEREQPELFKKQWAENPLGRMGRAEEVADAVVFLASKRAGFVTGANMLVDGGLSQGIQF